MAVSTAISLGALIVSIASYRLKKVQREEDEEARRVEQLERDLEESRAEIERLTDENLRLLKRLMGRR